MRNTRNHKGENEFAEMQYMNITVVTSNQPYGALDGSNPQITGHSMPKFNIHKNVVHSGHVQMGMQDPFCLQKGKRKISVKAKANHGKRNTDHSIRECKLSDSGEGNDKQIMIREAQIILSDNDGIYIVIGHICNAYDNNKRNIFTVGSNEYAEFNMLLDPSVAKVVFTLYVNITLVPLQMQGKVSSLVKGPLN
ncbi:hypothetical protein V6N12_049426 [Hibiscus sabdariffa]